MNDISQLGITFAHFRNIPAVASWHTNAHEYAAQRLASVIPWIEPNTRQKITKFVERAGMYGLMKLYFLALTLPAPPYVLVSEIPGVMEI